MERNGGRAVREARRALGERRGSRAASLALCLGLAACSGGSSGGGGGGGGGGTTWGISGTVGGATASGVTMTLSGAGGGTVATDATGNYSFTGLADGTYTVTPGKAGYAFTPASLSVTIAGANATGRNFTAAGACSISGQVTGTSPSGVTVSLTGTASGSTTTDSSGNYSFTGLAGGAYTVTPGKTGYAFTPASLSVTVSGANVTGRNFTVGSGNWDYLVWDQDNWQ